MWKGALCMSYEQALLVFCPVLKITDFRALVCLRGKHLVIAKVMLLFFFLFFSFMSRRFFHVFPYPKTSL